MGSLRPVLVTVGEVSLWWSSDPPVLLAPVTHHFAVDSTGYTVVQLCIELGQDIFYTKQQFKSCNLGVNQVKLTCVYWSLSNIPDSRSLNNISDNEFFDGLVFGDASSAVSATHRFHVAPSVLSASSVSTFASLKQKRVSLDVACFGAFTVWG